MLLKIVKLEDKCSWLGSFLEKEILQGTLLKLLHFLSHRLTKDLVIKRLNIKNKENQPKVPKILILKRLVILISLPCGFSKIVSSQERQKSWQY